jgi:pantetheine-phosphate adenylyltransferase
MKRIAVFPGSFDPITRGHEAVVRRAAELFDEIIVAIGHNTTKQTMFPIETRLMWIQKTFADLPQVKCEVYDGLTISFCKNRGARYLLRGLRNTIDFEYEKTIADANRAMYPDIETVFLTGEPKYTSVASTIVRDILRNGGNARPFLPDAVIRSLDQKNA